MIERLTTALRKWLDGSFEPRPVTTDEINLAVAVFIRRNMEAYPNRNGAINHQFRDCVLNDVNVGSWSITVTPIEWEE